ncbi:hypothetical protein DERP_001157 [Dermatophagoides pteronyssinus]|uniref:Uncharacterized protein n=1 Tax=Dermatophagoides pteronyssinus TaxID=6956 RepID=A0ABQ8JDN6_DERPT|nr:hypothetical protein DERP_001157 [Dermatophagoides pteronyssinus]
MFLFLLAENIINIKFSMFFFHIQTPFIYDDGKNGDEIGDQPNNNLVHKYTVIQGNIFDKDFWVSKMMIINGGSSCDIGAWTMEYDLEKISFLCSSLKITATAFLFCFNHNYQ